MPKAKPRPKAKVKQIPLEPAWSTAKRSVELIWDNKKLFSIILLFYALAYVIAVESSSSITSASTTLSHYESIYHGASRVLASGLSTFTSLIGSVSGTNAPTNGAYQTILFISLSLVIVWSVKQLLAKKKIKARDAFYKSHSPLIQFFLVLILIGIEFIPLLIGSVLYNDVITSGLAVSSIEKVLWIILCIVLAAISFYFVTSSLFALYLVNDGLNPMAAIKTARAYVKKRRMVVFGRIIFMPVILFLAIGIIMLPVILVVPVAAAAVLSALLLIGVTIFHSYMYNLSQVIKR